MADVFVTPTAGADLDRLIEALRLPEATRDRVRDSLRPLARFPDMGRRLTGRWEPFRFILGPWSWMLIVYAYEVEADRVFVVTIQDARSARSPTSAP